FTDLLERSYVGKIETYSGEKIVYTGEVVDGNYATVRSRIITRRRTDTALDYRMHEIDGRWKVYDVLIDGVSFVSTYRSEISAVTIISVPATAYSENWEYVQFFIGSSLAKWAVAFIFIPAFYRYEVTTIYQFLLHRFGQKSQVTASIFFFITRLAGSGARLTMTALAVGYLMGWSLVPTIVIFSVVSILYIATGGVKAVVWTNVFQAVMFLVAGAVTLGFLVSRIDGGAGAVLHTAYEAGRLNVINWGPAPG